MVIFVSISPSSSEQHQHQQQQQSYSLHSSSLGSSIIDLLSDMILFVAFCFFLLFVVYYCLVKKDTILSPKRKVIFITGCDSGIGLRVAKHLLQSGFIVISGCLNIESDGATQLNQLGGHMVAVDITKQSSINECFHTVQRILSQHDINGLWALINNAGICIYGEFDWLISDHITNQVNVNLMGTILVTKTFLPLIIHSKGRIINVSSVNGTCGYPGLSVYSATKFAIEGFTDVLRSEMNKFGVKVMVIRPGDFARLTNIMDSHRQLKDQMWNGMNEVKQSMYQEYFTDYHNHILQNYGMTSPVSFESSTLLNDFTNCLLSSNPPTEVTVAPLGFKLFFRVLSIIPSQWKDIFIDSLMSRVFHFDASKYFSPNK